MGTFFIVLLAVIGKLCGSMSKVLSRLKLKYGRVIYSFAYLLGLASAVLMVRRLVVERLQVKVECGKTQSAQPMRTERWLFR